MTDDKDRELRIFIVHLWNDDRAIRRNLRFAQRRMDKAEATMSRHTEGTPWHTRAFRQWSTARDALRYWQEVQAVKRTLIEQGIDPRSIPPRDPHWRETIVRLWDEARRRLDALAPEQR